ncbi:MAG TPA: tRNA pseudouridine(55) synthase TruB [Actinobacteria bacterium]|nr:tRNA pseudouridine(55) synthase TruB [Actinomycetota bacterium]
MSLDGLIVINKPAGITSHDVVEKVRAILKIKKVGHVGTLDPDATGVLVLLVGKATKIARFLQNDDKEYKAKMILGLKTDTQDLSGKVISKTECDISEEDVRCALAHFKGNISQTPPMVSAVKINGKPLYKLAREGKEVFRPPRDINIHSIDFLSMPKGLNPEVTFKVVCSKGTYIRTLCSDIGDFLGCGACLESLVRTRSGDYCLGASFSIEEVNELCKSYLFENFLISIQNALKKFPIFIIKETSVKDVLNGCFLTDKMVDGKPKETKEEQYVMLLNAEGGLLAISELINPQNGSLLAKPICVFPGEVAV